MGIKEITYFYNLLILICINYMDISNKFIVYA